jgi:hypothetical protein
MPNIRLFPPSSGPTSHTVNGRTYSASPGTSIDVPDFDAQVLQANGWTAAAPGGVGTTAQRPVNPAKGAQYHDTTLGLTVTWDGKAWRNPATGSAV